MNPCLTQQENAVEAIARVRQRPDRIGRALRQGQHDPCETSFMDKPFADPGAGELAAWSQIQFNAEVLMVLNTHGTEGRGAYGTIDRSRHPNGSTMTVLYNSEWSDEQIQNPPTDETVRERCKILTYLRRSLALSPPRANNWGYS